MRTNRTFTWLALGAAALAPLAVAALLYPLHGVLQPATVAVVLAGVVVGVAATGRRSAGVVGAISATLCFDFFHTQPYLSFTIHDSDDATTALVLLLVGVAVSEIVTRLRTEHEAVEASNNEIAKLHAVAELVADGVDPRQLIPLVNEELIRLLHLRACHFETLPPAEPAAQLLRTGEVCFGDLRWAVHAQGLPGEIELPVYGQGWYRGRFVMVPTPGLGIEFEPRIVAVALADQVGAAISLEDALA
jgi:K+-sensing histidine kinase KdpD